MKKEKTDSESRDDLRPEYDFRNGVRGRYADRVPEGARLVWLEPDVAHAFPTAEAVNEALRRVAKREEG